MSDASVLKEQQLCNYSRLVADLQARRWEAPKLRIANLSRNIVCLLTQGRTLLITKAMYRLACHVVFLTNRNPNLVAAPGMGSSKNAN